MNALLANALARLRTLLEGQRPGWVAGVSILVVIFASWSKAESGPEWATVTHVTSDCRTSVVTDAGAALSRKGCFATLGHRVCVRARSLPDLRGREWYWVPSTDCTVGTP